MTRLLLASTVLAFGSVAAAQETVTVYSYRQPDLIAPLMEAFTEATGYPTEAVFLKKGMIERVQEEGDNSPVDVYLTVDISRLVALKDAGITQATSFDGVTGNIPAQYADNEGHWYGLTQRGRVFYVAKDLANPPATYEDLADPAYAGMICHRDGQHPYNNALFASLIANLGEEATRGWMEGLKANLARTPTGNDRAQAKGIFEGECQIGIGNSYYVGLMITNETEVEQQDWAAAMNVVLPNSGDRGTHMNISGMAMAKNSPNAAGAQALMEFLASDAAQEIYAEIVFEYPVNPSASPSALVAGFGDLNPDTLALEDIAANSAAASALVDSVGLND